MPVRRFALDHAFRVEFPRHRIRHSPVARAQVRSGQDEAIDCTVVLYALTIGRVVHYALPFFTLDRKDTGPEPAVPARL